MSKVLFVAVLFAVMLQFVGMAHAIDFVDVRVENVRYFPYPVEPGQYFTIYFELVNAGNLAADNVAATVLPKYPFSLEAGDAAKKSFSTLPGGSRALVQYRVRVAQDAIDGANELTYNLKYGNIDGGEASFDVSVSRKNNLRIVKVSPTLVKPGAQTQLTFTIANKGNATAEGITLSWDDASKLIIPIGSENRKDVPMLRAGEQTDVTFDVLADPAISPGAYIITANISYSGANGALSLSTKTGIIVGGDADLEVTVQDYGAGRLSIAIANTGTNPASAASITIPNQPGITVTGATTQFIGNLLKGDYTLATFQVQMGGSDSAFAANARGSALPSDQPSQIGQQGSQGFQGRGRGNFTGDRANFTASEFRVIVAYTNTLGERKSVQQMLPINANFAEATGTTGTRFGTQAGLPWYAYAAGALVLAAIAFAYKRFKKPPAMAPEHARQEKR